MSQISRPMWCLLNMPNWFLYFFVESPNDITLTENELFVVTFFRRNEDDDGAGESMRKKLKNKCY